MRFSHEINPVWITSIFMLSLSSQSVYCNIYLFILETYNQAKSLGIQFNWPHISSVERKDMGHLVSLGLNGWWQVFWLTVTVLPWLIFARSIRYTKRVWKVCFKVAHLSSTERHWCGSGSMTLMGSYFNFVIEVMKFQPPIVYIPVWTHDFFVTLWVSSTIVIMNISTAFSRQFLW